MGTAGEWDSCYRGWGWDVWGEDGVGRGGGTVWEGVGRGVEG